MCDFILILELIVTLVVILAIFRANRALFILMDAWVDVRIGHQTSAASAEANPCVLILVPSSFTFCTILILGLTAYNCISGHFNVIKILFNQSLASNNQLIWFLQRLIFIVSCVSWILLLHSINFVRGVKKRVR